jgi:biopolymer transport protein TolQ
MNAFVADFLGAAGAAASAAPAPAPEEGAATIKLDLVALLQHASWPVRITVGLLLLASALVWIIAVLKFLQLSRLRASALHFERKARQAATSAELYDLASTTGGGSPGARVLGELFNRAASHNIERLRAVADRAIVAERQRAKSMMSSLASIASAAPFIGLFGTVYGIMDAFVRIGAAKSASLPVVAPAIGEALIATAIGLAAAIPAVVFYNSIDRRVGDVISELEAAAAEWVAVIADSNEAIPLGRPAGHR